MSRAIQSDRAPTPETVAETSGAHPPVRTRPQRHPPRRRGGCFFCVHVGQHASVAVTRSTWVPRAVGRAKGNGPAREAVARAMEARAGRAAVTEAPGGRRGNGGRFPFARPTARAKRRVSNAKRRTNNAKRRASGPSGAPQWYTFHSVVIADAPSVATESRPCFEAGVHADLAQRHGDSGGGDRLPQPGSLCGASQAAVFGRGRRRVADQSDRRRRRRCDLRGHARLGAGGSGGVGLVASHVLGGHAGRRPTGRRGPDRDRRVGLCGQVAADGARSGAQPPASTGRPATGARAGPCAISRT